MRWGKCGSSVRVGVRDGSYCHTLAWPVARGGKKLYCCYPALYLKSKLFTFLSTFIFCLCVQQPDITNIAYVPLLPSATKDQWPYGSYDHDGPPDGLQIELRLGVGCGGWTKIKNAVGKSKGSSR